ncbi:MAG: hypothetical protein WCY24_07015, partial [Lutispora sp.]
MRKFSLYQSGIHYGFIYFDDTNVFHEKLNVFNNELEELRPLSEEDYNFYNDFTKIDMKLLSERFSAYEEIFTKSKEDKIETPFGEKYSKYNNVWVQRNKKFPLDVVIEDNKIVGFNCPAREWCTCLVEDGYELSTSLKVWKEKRKDEKIYAVEFL